MIPRLKGDLLLKALHPMKAPHLMNALHLKIARCVQNSLE